MAPRDTFQRPLDNLRLSVTDRCNLRCSYCMPEESYTWLSRRDLLDFEEIERLVGVFTAVGVTRVRLTGGEPLLRRDVDRLVALLARNEALRDIAMTTNGLLLGECAGALARAGLHRVTISLDTLRRDRFRELTRRDDLARVLDGIEAARAAGFEGTKIDAVVIRGTNEDELADLLAYGREVGAEVRFIEYMDVGGATRWSASDVVPRAEILERIAAVYGAAEPLREESSAPADRYRLSDGTVFGVIASTTEPFCAACDRSRLTADGMWYLCLYAKLGIDLRGPLRTGESTEELLARIERTWSGRADRGAEERLARVLRAPLAERAELERDPHLEMHTRGG